MLHVLSNRESLAMIFVRAVGVVGMQSAIARKRAKIYTVKTSNDDVLLLGQRMLKSKVDVSIMIRANR